MSEARYITARLTTREQMAYDVRILEVLARSEFKLKYAGSVLGYVWSLAKPLALLHGALGRLRQHLQVEHRPTIRSTC